MENFKNQTPRSNNRAILFIDYLPAELKKGKDWIVVYYTKNPLTKQNNRHRVRVPKIKNTKEREKIAKKMCSEINNRLQNGWIPELEKQEKFYTKFKDVQEIYLNRIKTDMDKGLKRYDTLKSYKSMISVINIFIFNKNYKIEFIAEFNKEFCISYLDYMLYDRNCSNTTYNNHLTFLVGFGNWLVERNYIKENPTKGIPRKDKETKKRQVLPNDTKKEIKNHLIKSHIEYYTLMMCTYYCLIRRTELTKLKVSNVSLANNTIEIPKESSKNKKTEIVSIPEPLVFLLVNHLKKANNSDWLFSDNSFRPGKTQLKPKKISDFWLKIRVDLSLPKEYQFYSLKDTGITDLLEAGLPAIKVRNQARHYDIKITETYTPRLQKADDDIIKSKISF